MLGNFTLQKENSCHNTRISISLLVIFDTKTIHIFKKNKGKCTLSVMILLRLLYTVK